MGAKYKLTYFNIRGRAELLRYVFAVANVEYVDERITSEQWAELKPKTPFGSLPTLEVKGKVMAETVPIAKYLAREFDLYGKTNEEKWLTDVIIDFTTEIRTGLEHLRNVKEETQKEEAWRQLLEEVAPKPLSRLEAFLSDNESGKGFLVGNQLTVADLFVYDTLSFVLKERPELLSKFPLLTANRKKVEELPRFANWLKTRPVTDF